MVLFASCAITFLLVEMLSNKKETKVKIIGVNGGLVERVVTRSVIS